MTSTVLTEDVRAKYKELKARADAIWGAADKVYKEALVPWHVLNDQIEEMIEGAGVGTCEGCSSPVFEGDPSHPTTDGILCGECAPSYQDVLDCPESFMGANEEPMTAEEAKAMCDAHIASGGSLSDSLARRGQ